MSKFSTYIFILFLYSNSSIATSYTGFVELEEPQVSRVQSQFLDRTKDALLSYDYIEERADYVIFKLKNITFREYTEHILYFAPLVTGNVQVRLNDFDIYYDYNSAKSGFQYKIRF